MSFRAIGWDILHLTPRIRVLKLVVNKRENTTHGFHGTNLDIVRKVVGKDLKQALKEKKRSKLNEWSEGMGFLHSLDSTSSVNQPSTGRIRHNSTQSNQGPQIIAPSACAGWTTGQTFLQICGQQSRIAHRLPLTTIPK